MEGKRWNDETYDILNELLSYVEGFELDDMDDTQVSRFLEGVRDGMTNGDFVHYVGHNDFDPQTGDALRRFEAYMNGRIHDLPFAMEGSEDENDDTSIELTRESIMNDIQEVIDGGPDFLGPVFGNEKPKGVQLMDGFSHMNFSGGDKQSMSLHERLLNVMQNTYIHGVEAGMPTAWLYDCTIASIAVHMAQQKLQEGLSPEDAEKLVSDVEGIDFNVFGETKYSFTNEEWSAYKKKYTREVVKPLYDAYMNSKEARTFSVCADGYMKYIIEQWMAEE